MAESTSRPTADNRKRNLKRRSQEAKFGYPLGNVTSPSAGGPGKSSISILSAKTDVRIIDFVDTGHQALLRMWDKRQRGYRAMGYKIGSETETQTTIRL
jgi:hypothetical protein